MNTAPAITPPAGWTLIRSDTALGSGNAIIQSAYYHVAGASEPASYTWTLASSHAASGGMLAYSGVSTSNPIDVSGGQTASSSANLTAPSVVTTVANAMLVGLYGMNGIRTLTQPAGMAERLEVANASGEKVTSEAADVVKATAGATGTKVATSASSGKNVGQLIALRPGP